MKNIRLLAILTFIFFMLGINQSAAEQVNVVISADSIMGKVNPLVFGSSILGYDPATINGKEKYTGYSNYGGGIWDPRTMQSVQEVISLTKDAGIRIVRFPGGNGSTFYNWKKTIGSTMSRPDFLYGLNEFMKTSKQINAEAILVLPYFSGTPQDAADLVEYLNAPNDGSNPGGGKDWAGERAKNGYPEPYGVRLFELGNEVNFGRAELGISPVDPVMYGNNYIKYRQSMKAIDSSIKLGAVAVNSNSVRGISAWNDKVFQVAGHLIDFLIEHTYSPGYMSNNKKVNVNKLFESTLNSLGKIDKYYKTLSRHFEMVTGRKDIPLAVTEYNARFVQNKPAPFRHGLGTALFNAGLFQLFLKPENNIMMAIYHQHVNSYWGMIKNDRFMKLKGHYIKRPNYYLFEMYAKHFGAELLKVNDNSSVVQSPINKKDNLLSNIKWKSKLFPKADIEILNNKVKITFSRNADINFAHVRKKVPLKPNTTYRLSGYIRAENLLDNEGVSLEIQDERGWKKTHSAASTRRVWGTTAWTYVEAEYTTLTDTSHALVLIRRKSGQGTVKGSVYIKDVNLTEIEESSLRASDLLVSASRSADNKTLFVMALNKSVYHDIDAVIHVDSKRELSKSMLVWTLNGPSIWANNEKDPNNVIIQDKHLELNDEKQINYIFPAHSLTSIELKIQ